VKQTQTNLLQQHYKTGNLAGVQDKKYTHIFLTRLPLADKIKQSPERANKMKKIDELKFNQIEYSSLSKIKGGRVYPAGSQGSWSWTAGSITKNGVVTTFYENIEYDYTGHVSCDGHVIQLISPNDEVGHLITN
jgi:hypothetical protein